VEFIFYPISYNILIYYIETYYLTEK
jgi:hypothetical protein